MPVCLRPSWTRKTQSGGSWAACRSCYWCSTPILIPRKVNRMVRTTSNVLLHFLLVCLKGCLQNKNRSCYVFSRQLQNCRPLPHPLSQTPINMSCSNKKLLIFGIFETIQFWPSSPPHPCLEKTKYERFFFASIPNQCVCRVPSSSRKTKPSCHFSMAGWF